MSGASAVARVFIVQRHLLGLLPGLRERFEARASFDGVEDPAGFPERVLDSDVLLGWQVRSEWLPRLPRLRWIHCSGAGVDRLVGTDGLPPEVVITRTHGNFGRQMGEYALSAMFHHAGRWEDWRIQQQAHAWQRHVRALLRDARAGVMGLGVIGGEVAGLLSAAGLEVWGWSRSGRSHPACTRVLPGERLDEFLEGLDYLIMTLPLTPATRWLLDGHRLRLMKKGAVLVNMARAEIIEEEALRGVLEEGRLGAVYLDVMWHEPLPPESPWWSRERVFITPHIAGITEAEDLIHEFSENLERYLAGQPLLSVVDRARGY